MLIYPISLIPTQGPIKCISCHRIREYKLIYCVYFVVNWEHQVGLALGGGDGRFRDKCLHPVNSYQLLHRNGREKTERSHIINTMYRSSYRQKPPFCSNDMTSEQINECIFLILFLYWKQIWSDTITEWYWHQLCKIEVEFKLRYQIKCEILSDNLKNSNVYRETRGGYN